MAQKTAHHRLTAAERKREIIRLRRDGYLLTEIGREVGSTPQYCHKVITEYLENLISDTKDETELLRQMEYERLERMHRAAWPSAINGDLAAIDRVIKIMERQAKLFGLDKPVKVAPTSPGGEGEYTGGGLAGLLAEIERDNLQDMAQT